MGNSYSVRRCFLYQHFLNLGCECSNLTLTLNCEYSSSSWNFTSSSVAVFEDKLQLDCGKIEYSHLGDNIADLHLLITSCVV